MRRAGALVAAMLAAAVALAACGSITPAAKLSQWASANDFDGGIGDLVFGVHAVDADIVHHAPALSTRTDCADLFVQANGVNSDLIPTPDAELTTLLTQAVASRTGIVHAAALCESDPSSARALSTTLSELRASLGPVYAAAYREEAVTGRKLAIPGVP